MQEFLQKIRTHFNIIHQEDFLSLTLINPNLDLKIIKEIKQTFRLQHHIKKQQIIIIESENFNDQLLQQLAQALPQSLEELTLDFTGCESLKAQGFVCLFQRLGSMNLRKLKLDFSEIIDIDDLVMEALSLLLEGLQQLQQFYLDLYEVDQITQDGYLAFAESLNSLKNLKSLHLDFSANPNLTQDCLQLIFTNIETEILKNFSFRILDIDHIGGGSFFKLGQILNKMKNLQSLSLTISTFSNLNHKGIYAVIKQITYLDKLKDLTLNFSDILLPTKILTYLNLPPAVENFNLDVSCNNDLTDGDALTLVKNVKNLSVLTLNLDFCKNITQDSIEEILYIFFNNKKCKQLFLPDRAYSLEFQKLLLRKVAQVDQLVRIQVTDIKSEIQQEWANLQNLLQKKRNQGQASQKTAVDTKDSQFQKND